MRTLGVVAAVVGLALGTASGAQASARQGDDVALRTALVATPSVVTGTDGRRHMLYEMLVRNGSSRRMRIDRLVVRDAGRDAVVASYRGAAIEALILTLDRGVATRTLAAGGTSLVVFDIEMAGGRALPERLSHRFTLSNGASVTRAATRVDTRAPLRIGPPLRGAGLGVIGCCERAVGHRLGLLPFGDEIFHAQRYAIDFLRLDQGLSPFAGDPSVNASYFIYGSEIIAVAPGKIVAARDGVPENTPPTPPANPAVDDLAGNFISQDLANGRYAFYAHLQPGSLRVAVGDFVARGQVLGLVGNSGNSTGPHLHFHITNGRGGPTTLAANGLPYVFDAMRLESRVTGLDRNPPAPVRAPVPGSPDRAGEYPFSGDIVGFP